MRYSDFKQFPNNEKNIATSIIKFYMLMAIFLYLFLAIIKHPQQLYIILITLLSVST